MLKTLPWRRWQTALIDLIFPPACSLCGCGGAYLCDRCLGRIARYVAPPCPVCERATRDGRPHADCRAGSVLDGWCVVGPYQDPLGAAIRRYKYEFLHALGPPLGALLAERVASAPSPRFDGVVPVPLHPSRRRWRGFNQAEPLAQAIGERLGAPVRPELLARQRATTPQVHCPDPASRRGNLAGAFTCPDPPPVRRGRWLLVDDVTTSGATLAECAAALRAAGARSVWAATLAHG